jgi:hypothetical protein
MIMKRKIQNGKFKFYKSLFSFIWVEIKTMNVEKLRSMVNLAWGFLALKKSKKAAKIPYRIHKAQSSID